MVLGTSERRAPVPPFSAYRTYATVFTGGPPEAERKVDLLAPVCSNCGATDFVWANDLKTGGLGGGSLSLRSRGELSLGTRICRACGHADLFLKDPSILRMPHTWRPGEFTPITPRPAASPAHHPGHSATAPAPAPAAKPVEAPAPPTPPPPPPPPPEATPRAPPPAPPAREHTPTPSWTLPVRVLPTAPPPPPPPAESPPLPPEMTVPPPPPPESPPPAAEPAKRPRRRRSPKGKDGDTVAPPAP